MTTFTLRGSEALTGRLSSAQMRSWLEDFLRQPHTLPPDPGSGSGRVSMTLTGSAVSTVTAYCRCEVSSVLRRIAVERLGTPRLTSGQLPGVPAPRARIIKSETAWDRAAAPQDSLSQAGAMAAVLIPTFLWILIIATCFFFNSRKKEMPKTA